MTCYSINKMIIMHSNGVVMPRYNGIISGGSIKKSQVAVIPVNNPIFALKTAAPVSSSNGSFLGGAVADIKFNSKKRKQNIKFIL